MPLSYLGRPVTSALQLLSAFRVTVWPLDRVTVMEDGRMPSWSSLSSQTL